MLALRLPGVYNHPQPYYKTQEKTQREQLRIDASIKTVYVFSFSFGEHAYLMFCGCINILKNQMQNLLFLNTFLQDKLATFFLHLHRQKISLYCTMKVDRSQYLETCFCLVLLMFFYNAEIFLFCTSSTPCLHKMSDSLN